MSWDVAKVAHRCERCKRAIGAGEMLRRGVVARSCVWCEDCAAIEFTETVPAVLEREATSFRRPRPSESLLRTIHDGRMAATGEQE